MAAFKRALLIVFDIFLICLLFSNITWIYSRSKDSYRSSSRRTKVFGKGSSYKEDSHGSRNMAANSFTPAEKMKNVETEATKTKPDELKNRPVEYPGPKKQPNATQAKRPNQRTGYASDKIHDGDINGNGIKEKQMDDPLHNFDRVNGDQLHGTTKDRGTGSNINKIDTAIKSNENSYRGNGDQDNMVHIQNVEVNDASESERSDRRQVKFRSDWYDGKWTEEELLENRQRAAYQRTLMLKGEPTYNASFKNPCWYEEFTEEPEACKQHSGICHIDGKSSGGQILRCLPYYYIIGVPKAGTCDLFRRILGHPDIMFAAMHQQFWAKRRYRICSDLEDGYASPDCYSEFDSYVNHYHEQAFKINLNSVMTSGGHPYHKLVFGEGSPTTFMHYYGSYERSPDGAPVTGMHINPVYLHKFQPNAKIILILRSPVSRTYSSYRFFGYKNMDRRGEFSPEQFHQQVLYSIELFNSCVRQYGLKMCLYGQMRGSAGSDKGQFSDTLRLYHSVYAPYVADWLRFYERRNILVIRSEDYAARMADTLRQIYAFLDLPDADADTIQTLVSMPHSNTNPVSIAPMLPQTKALLERFFAPYNQQLAELLGDEKFLWKDS